MPNPITIMRRESLPSSTPNLFAAYHPVLRQIYQSRGVQSADDVQYALQQLASFKGLKGIDDAVALLIDVIVSGKKLLIVGDFDADGATSTALAMLAFPLFGLNNIGYLVPNRFKDGYGLTPSIVEQARPRQVDVIMTVDNGIASVEGVDYANQLGMAVLVTDHHLASDVLPKAAAIVNPNQPDCAFSSKNLAGVGVVFYVLMALRAAMREQGLFAKLGLSEPNLAEFLDIVALGTVADVVSLDKINRILVFQGLQRIRAGFCRPGIRELISLSNRNLPTLSATDLGYALAPRLNAAGRLDDMSLGIECLMAQDVTKARMIASRLEQLNHDRKEIEAQMKQSALDFLADVAVDDCSGICLYQPDWHQGVIGILASRIKTLYHRPTLIFAQDGDELKGSARSIVGFHMRDALDLISKRHPNLIKRFGGHAMAAGLTIDGDDFVRFAKIFDEVVRESVEPHVLQAVLLTDGELAPSDINLTLAKLLRDAGPFGQNFPEPLFDGQFTVMDARVLGDKHLKWVLSHPDDPSCLFDAIAFNVESELLQTDMSEIELVYRLDVNQFRGRETVQLLAEYWRPIV